MHHTSYISIAVVIALGAVALLPFVPAPLHAVLENRLIVPDIEKPIDKHTPIRATGTFLPSAIMDDTTLSPDQNPILITTPTTVPRGVTLTLLPGTRVAVAEYAALHIEGKLTAQGTPADPIMFVTNERHAENAVWGGIIVRPKGEAVVTYARISNASPGVACYGGSITVRDIVIALSNEHSIITDDACVISQRNVIFR